MCVSWQHEDLHERASCYNGMHQHLPPAGEPPVLRPGHTHGLISSRLVDLEQSVSWLEGCAPSEHVDAQLARCRGLLEEERWRLKDMQEHPAKGTRRA